MIDGILLTSDIAKRLGYKTNETFKRAAKLYGFPKSDGAIGNTEYWIEKNIRIVLENWKVPEKTVKPKKPPKEGIKIKQVMSTGEKLLTAQTLSKELGISTGTVRELVKKGRIPSPHVSANGVLKYWIRNELINSSILEK